MRRHLSDLVLLSATAIATLSACSSGTAPARPQIILTIDTDLPVPPDPNLPAPAEVTPVMVDTARVDVVTRGTTTLVCTTPSACSRDFALDQAQLTRHAISFGLVALGSDSELRIRLFRHDTVDSDGQPLAGATDEVRARPTLPASGVVNETYLVPGDDWGQSGASAPRIEGTPGSPAPTAAGTWPSAQSSPCTVAPRTDMGHEDGEQCIAGGALLLNAPDGATAILSTGLLFDARAVVMSPFLLDTYELTVSRFSALTLPADVNPPVTYAANDSENPWRAYCTLGAPFPDADKLPLNCVSALTADAICAQLGSRLPTELELTYASLGRSDQIFPWGTAVPEYSSPTDPDTLLPCCGGAVFDRYPVGQSVTGVSYDDCSASTAPPPGPFAAQPEAVDGVLGRALTGACTNVRDVSRDGVVGLGGNVSEWAADFFAAPDCWYGTTPQRDPVCAATPGASPFRYVFGGSWLDPPGVQTGIWCSSEGSLDVLHEHPGTGLRCARDGVVR